MPSSDELSPIEPRSLMSFFRNPIVGFVGTVVSVLSMGLSVYFYVQDHKFPALTYYVNPAKAVVVHAGETSKLRVLMDDQEIRSDVTAAQVQIWNQGKTPIRSGAVLSPLIIRTDSSAPILEANIRKTSRDVIHLALDKSQLSSGVVAVSWNILEQGDGGIIQIIFAGSPDTKITAAAVLEGQAAISQLIYPLKSISASEQIQKSLKTTQLVGLLIFELALLTLLTNLTFSPNTFQDTWKIRNRKLLLIGRIVTGVCAVVLSVLSIYIFLKMHTVTPPFGY